MTILEDSDLFYTPSHCSFTPWKVNDFPRQQVTSPFTGKIPTSQEMIPNRQEMISSHQEMISTRQEMISTRQEMIPARQEMIPTRQEMIPARQEMIPTRQEMIPERPEVFSGPTRHKRVTVLNKYIYQRINVTAYNSTLPKGGLSWLGKFHLPTYFCPN